MEKKREKETQLRKERAVAVVAVAFLVYFPVTFFADLLRPTSYFWGIHLFILLLLDVKLLMYVRSGPDIDLWSKIRWSCMSQYVEKNGDVFLYR